MEHIVPESLGNKTNVLRKGIVCDSCNNYFAVKIEKPVMEMPFFKALRFRNRINSKKGRVPSVEGWFPYTNFRTEIVADPKTSTLNAKVDPKTFALLESGEVDQIYVKENLDFPKTDQTISRFLGKIGLEMMALKIAEDNKNLEAFIDDEELDPLRHHVRFNSIQEHWRYSVRKIYSENEKFYLSNGESTDMLFESDFLITDRSELYFIVAFKGFEFVLNMGGTSLDGFNAWLKINKNISPLYRPGRHFGYDLTPDFKKNNIRNNYSSGRTNE